MDKLKNSSDIHRMSPETHLTFI